MKTGLAGSMLVLAILVSPVFKSQPSMAGDFGSAQQTFVPASLIPRRVDLDSEGQTTWSSTNQNGFPTDPNAVNALLNGLGTGNTYPTSNGGSSGGTIVTTGKGTPALHKLIGLGRFDDAEMTAKNAVAKNPKDPKLKADLAEVLVSKAKHFLSKGDLNAAGAKAREALVYEPGSHEAKAVVSQILAKQGLNGQNPKDHLKVADAMASQRRYMEAGVEYKLSLELKPSGAGHIGLGNLAVSAGKIEEAKKEYQVAIELDPKSSVAYRQLGALSYSMHDLANANTDLGKALSINGRDQLACSLLIELWQRQVTSAPTSVNAHLGLARAYLQTGELELAKTEYQQVARLEPNNPNLPQARAAYKACLARREAAKCYEAAKTLDSTGADGDAHEKLLESLSYDPGSIGCLLLNGKVCEKLGLYNDAHDAYMSVLKEDPRNLIAAQRLKALVAKGGGTKLASSGLAATAQSLPASSIPPRLASETPHSDASEPVAPAHPYVQPAAPPQLAPAHAAVPVVPVAESLPAITPSTVPASTNSVPTLQPETPALQPETPTLQPEIPTLQPETPTLQPTATTPPSQSTNQPASTTTTIETPTAGFTIPSGVPLGVPAGDLQPDPVSEQAVPTTSILPLPNENPQSASHINALGNFLTTLRNTSTQQAQSATQYESQTKKSLQAAGLLPGSPSSSYGSLSGNYGSLGGSSIGGSPVGLPLLSASQMNALTAMPATVVGDGSTPLYLTSPGSTAIQLPTSTTTTSVSSSPSATKSLMQFLATPVAQKMGFQPIDSSAQTTQTTGYLPAERIVQGTNGQYYMVPTAVPVAMDPSQNGPGSNQAVNNFLNSKFGQRFHLGGMARANSAIANAMGTGPAGPAEASGQAISSLPNPMNLIRSSTPKTNAVESVTAQMNEDPNQAAAAAAAAAAADPLVQIKDFGTSEPEAPASDTTAIEPKMSTETPAVAMVPGGTAPPTTVVGAEPTPALKPPVLVPSINGQSINRQTSNRQVTLELADVKPSSSGIKVKVLLRNQGRTDVKIPDNQKIAIRSAGHADQLLDVHFDSHSVTAGGSVTGTIKIPGHDIDPRADVFLPNFLGDGTQLSDLHLTTAPDSSM